jgi:hypothetical protein
MRVLSLFLVLLSPCGAQVVLPANEGCELQRYTIKSNIEAPDALLVELLLLLENTISFHHSLMSLLFGLF